MLPALHDKLLSQSVFVFVVCAAQTFNISLHNINRQVFIMERQGVLCELQNELLKVVQNISRLRSVRVSNCPSIPKEANIFYVPQISRQDLGNTHFVKWVPGARFLGLRRSEV
jgi:hypothetical protein